MLYAYIRVSTKRQSLERQRLNIVRAYPGISDKNIIEEKETGTRIDTRPRFRELLNTLKEGDTLVMDSVSRFSREAEAGFRLYQTLYDRGVNLVFLKEPYINTDVYRSALNIELPKAPDKCLEPMFLGIKQTLMLLAERQFKTAFDQAEKEVKDLSTRTSEGMKAKDAGDKIAHAKRGRTYLQKKAPEAMNEIKRLSRDFDGTLTDADVIRFTGLSRNTYYKYKRILKESV